MGWLVRKSEGASIWPLRAQTSQQGWGKRDYNTEMGGERVFCCSGVQYKINRCRRRARDIEIY